MKLSPYRKLIILLIIVYVGLIIIKFQDYKELKESIFVYSPFTIAFCILAIRTKMIYIGKQEIVIKKFISKDIYITAAKIQKIELESTRSGRWEWDRIYYYTDNRIYENSITWFPHKELLKALLQFCAINNIELNVSEFKIKKNFFF